MREKNCTISFLQ